MVLYCPSAASTSKSTAKGFLKDHCALRRYRLLQITTTIMQCMWHGFCVGGEGSIIGHDAIRWETAKTSYHSNQKRRTQASFCNQPTTSTKSWLCLDTAFLSLHIFSLLMGSSRMKQKIWGSCPKIGEVQNNTKYQTRKFSSFYLLQIEN